MTREIVQHAQRIQAVLEEANVKLASVISNVLGPSGRRILRAIIAGETDAAKLAALGSERLGCPRAALAEALTGRVRELTQKGASTGPGHQFGVPTNKKGV